MISSAVDCFWLLATRPDSYRVWGRFDRQRATFGATEWLIAAGAIALVVAVWVSYRLAIHHQKEFWCDNSSRLFHDLCRAHRLDLANRRLMKKLASERGVDHPADLFVEPEYFDTANLPPALKTSATELRQLRHQLFE